MMRKSPLKSPMQKISTLAGAVGTRTSSLLDSASSAVEKGAQLSNAVVSRAEELVKSPDKHHRGGGGGGIRDRINKFDSASKSNVGQGRNGRHSSGGHGRHQWSRHRGGRREDEEEPQHANFNNDSRDNDDGEGYESVLPVPPPCNPGYHEKENEPNHQSYPGYATFSNGKEFAKDGVNLTKEFAKDGVKKFRRKKTAKQSKRESSPVNPNYEENRRREVEEAMKNERKKQERKTSHQDSQYYEEDKKSNRGSEITDRQESYGMDIAESNRAALLPNSHAAKTRRRDTAKSNASSGYGIPPSSQSGRKRSNQKQAAHPLIQSPLRKHIRGVHASAASNAACTQSKEPFRLFPPERLVGSGTCVDDGAGGGALAAVAGWNNDARDIDGRKNDGHYLETLGNMTGNVTDTIDKQRMNDNANKKRTRGAGGSGEGRDNEPGEEALDLLTSAAFLFKHSRRNLG